MKEDKHNIKEWMNERINEQKKEFVLKKSIKKQALLI